MKERCMNDNRPARYELFTRMHKGWTNEYLHRQVVCKQCYDKEAQEVAGFFFVEKIVDMKEKH
jgi:hypothetical protein